MALPRDFLYWPDTAHPSLERVAEQVRVRLGSQPGQVVCFAKVAQVPDLWGHAKACEPQSLGVVVETLTIHKAAGPAPYVGRPFVYTWRVAMGEGNRWVAGEARIEYLPPDWTDPATWL